MNVVSIHMTCALFITFFKRLFNTDGHLTWLVTSKMVWSWMAAHIQIIIFHFKSNFKENWRSAKRKIFTFPVPTVLISKWRILFQYSNCGIRAMQNFNWKWWFDGNHSRYMSFYLFNRSSFSILWYFGDT
jgi:hypothetical protein